MILISLLLLAFHSECLSIVVDHILSIERTKNPEHCNWNPATVYMKLKQLVHGEYIHSNILKEITPLLHEYKIDMQVLMGCKQFCCDIVTSGGTYRYYGDVIDSQAFIKSSKLAVSRVADFDLAQSYGHHLAVLAAAANAAAIAVAEAVAVADQEMKNEQVAKRALEVVQSATKFRRYG